jgi:hypothetical protein
MDSAQIGVLEQVHKKSLGSFLKCLNSLRLPSHAVISWPECEGYLSDEAGEWQLPDEQIGAALQLSDLP